MANATIATLGREKAMLEARLREYSATTQADAVRFAAQLKSYVDFEGGRQTYWVHQLRAENGALSRERADMLRRAPELLGKKLTVRYQEMTDGGVPRFPVGVAVRDYE